MLSIKKELKLYVMKHKNIYLVFSKTGTLFSKALTIFSETKYVHASLSFDDSFTRMYSFGRRNPNNPFSGGFVEENIYDGLYKKFPESECLIYKIRVTEDQYYNLQKAVEDFLRDKDKYRYNLLGVFSILLNRPIKRKYHYFCSQFVSEVLKKGSVYESDKAPELTVPSDLFAIENKHFIYEGLTKKVYSVV
jgi:hypothetical protein